MAFTQLNLLPQLIAALPADITEPTEIQRLAIPPALAGQDMIALAQTGSGKTLAFGLPLLQLIDSQSTSIQAVVLVPTRELACQISEGLQTVAQARAIDVVTLCGGVSQGSQVAQLAQGAQLIVATPGRLLDLLQQHIVDPNAVKSVVLDEADRLVDLGFWPDIQRIMAFFSADDRQTLLFSATLMPKLAALVTPLLTDPVRLETQTAHGAITHMAETLYLVNKGSKAKALQALLAKHQWSQVLVFIGARESADKLTKKLVKAGINAAALHGDKDHTIRQQRLADFHQHKINVLIATDVLARGIDIAQLPVVINFDLPVSAPVYVHRVGRTARAGRAGQAISLVCHGEMSALAAIRSFTDRALELQTLADFPVTDQPVNNASKRAPRDKMANRRTAKRKMRDGVKPRR